MLPSFFRTTVTVERAATTQQRGTTVRDWAHSTTHQVGGCSVQPVATATAWGEVAQPATYDAVMFAPPGADIQEGDRVTARGVTYHVEGMPLPWESPTGAVDHVEARLVTWRG